MLSRSVRDHEGVQEEESRKVAEEGLVTSLLPIEKTAVLHVHTRASDGTGTVEEVIEAALECGADILGINDHRTLWARERGYGGWHSGLFLMAGTELEDTDENSHILAYGIDSLPPTGITREQIAYINARGGIAIAAHPAEVPGRLPKTRSYFWNASFEGLSGVEVWNYMSLWKRGLSALNFPSRIRMPDRMVEHPNPEAIDIWEKVGGCAVAGPDAHALRFGLGRFRVEVFPYRMLFRRLRTHILLREELPEDPSSAERLIIDALREARCFTSNMLLGDAGGFRAHRYGDSLILVLPGDGDVTVADPGGILWQGSLRRGDHSLPASTDGPVSVFIERKGRTWIYQGIPCSSWH